MVWILVFSLLFLIQSEMCDTAYTRLFYEQERTLDRLDGLLMAHKTADLKCIDGLVTNTESVLALPYKLSSNFDSVISGAFEFCKIKNKSRSDITCTDSDFVLASEPNHMKFGMNFALPFLGFDKNAEFWNIVKTIAEPMLTARHALAPLCHLGLLNKPSNYPHSASFAHLNPCKSLQSF